ncbi:MAG: fibronectin type III domain-containing protein [Gammaproteobacteria bacterium]
MLRLVAWMAFAGMLVAAQSAWSAIGFVQVSAGTSGGPQTSITATFANAQNGGDLNVVIVGWYDSTSNVTSITDTRGNTYALAVGPTRYVGAGTLLIYYAKNIVAAAAGANTITITFSSAVAYPDARIAEYSGVDTVGPFDVGSGASGNSGVSNSGAATTTNANDLLVAGNFIGQWTASAGTGFTSRIVSDLGQILEDRVVTSTGSYSATANIGSDWWVMAMAAFKAASGGDTQAPTAPTNLTATAASSTQVNLSWTASTDNVAVTGYRVERCQGAGCSTFAQVGTPTGTTFNDTSLSASTSYTYRVRAQDAVPNLGSYSGTASATTQAAADTQAPTAPTNLTATAASSTQVNLSWTASTDNVAVTGYRVERCQGSGCSTFTQVGTPTGATFNDTGLSASTSYTYRVRAQDAVPNLSAYSSTGSAMTQAAPDTEAPAAPTTLSAAAASSYQIDLTWTASTDNVAVTGYRVERCSGASCSSFTQVATTTGTSFSDTSLSASTSYTYRIRAQDAVPNLSTYSGTASATTQVGAATQASVTYTYDELGRLRTGAYNDGKRVDYQYDPAGNRTTMVTGSPPTVQIGAPASSPTEGSNLVFPVTKIGSSSQDITVACVPSDGTASSTGAAPLDDYVRANQTITFPPSDPSPATRNCTITTKPDSWHEGPETVNVVLQNASAGTSIVGGSVVGTITDDDAAPNFTVSGDTQNEGATLVFTVTKNGLTEQTHSVNYASADGSASLADGDYTAVASSLTFASAQSTQTVNVATGGDAKYETNETIALILSSPTNGASIGVGSATGTIVNDDAAPSVAINSPAAVNEGGQITFTVTKTGASQLSHSFDWATSNGTATSGTDYTAASGTIVFGPADVTKQFVVQTLTDGVSDGANETFVATLALNASSNGASISASQGTGTIIDLDLAIPSVPQNLSRGPNNLAANYTLSWLASVGPVSYYRLEEDLNSTDIWGLSYTINAPTLSKTFTNKPDDEYRYRVRACTSTNQCSAPSNVVTKNVCAHASC